MPKSLFSNSNLKLIVKGVGGWGVEVCLCVFAYTAGEGRAGVHANTV